MRTMTVGEFKSRFSEVLEWIKDGEEVAVTFGRAKEIVGYFMPSHQKDKKFDRQIGKYDNTPGYYMAEDFTTTTEEEFSINGKILP